ncbi:alpha-glycosidase [Lederbergia graminis]|uniref:Alpha-glycosidase n=1 Tax=Lederbergia graminis TaxID=735518 RepID=A0ABW0LHX8_9BACI
MNRLAILHRATDNYAYVCSNYDVCIMIKTGKGEIDRIQLIHGDPYHWTNGKWCNDRAAMEKTGSDEHYDYWQILITTPTRRLRYGFQLSNKKESVFLGEDGFYSIPPNKTDKYFAFPFVHSTEVFAPPNWVKDTVWYQIFPERFANGNKKNDVPGTLAWGSTPPKPDNFFGGDLDGIIDHIPYLKDLGITGIYFTPLFTAKSNHKYDTIDYLEIDPQFGDKKTLKKLIDICHKNGIKVMLDAVFNHSGFYFPPFQDVLKNGPDSKYKDWFHIREFPIQTKPLPNYDTFAFTPYMPKLNTQNPEVRNYLLKVARYWVEEFNIDGWRLDVANEVDHTFWRDFRNQIKAIKPDVYILGEIWHDAMPWLRGDQFDAVMNYPLTRNVLALFANRTITSEEFISKMTKVIHMYPATVNASAFNLVGSHDTPRILHECDGDIRKVKQIFTFLLTFIGTPCIYYGDEIGMDGDGDPGCRKCMEWDISKQDRDMFSHIQKLIQLRKQEPLLANEGSLRFISFRENGFAFVKASNNKKILVAFNVSNKERSFSLPQEYADLKPINLYSGQAQTSKTIKLDAYGFAILEFNSSYN